PTTGVEWTGMAIGTALLAGTSAFGRRGGVFGTLFAVVLLTLFVTYSDLRDWDIALGAVAAVTLAAGLVVTRLVETFGRPRSAIESEEDWQPEDGAPDPDWGAGQTARSNVWSSALPAQPGDNRGSPWVTDRWDTTNR
ncbi:MAG TPA: ABC transporter permease, partial [Micromonospora sp.]